MRTLPLGVLIVCGGTFAALPFRRYQPDQMPIVDPFRVTGPEYSSLIPDEFETTSLRADVLRLDSNLAKAAEEIVSGESEFDEGQDLKSMPRYLVRRSLDIPLTFEDLAQPIEHPGSAKDRWVTTESNDQQAGDTIGLGAQDRDAIQVGDSADDRWNSLVQSTTQPHGLSTSHVATGEELLQKTHERWSAEQVFDQPTDRSVSAGRFASTGPNQSSLGTSWTDASSTNRVTRPDSATGGDGEQPYSSARRALPEPTGRDRDHQWIKQP